MKFLARGRKVAAIIVFACFLAVFARFDSFAAVNRYLSSIQILPALILGAALPLLIVLFLTLLSGRVYCSLLCPLGLIQDFFGRIRKLNKRPVYRFTPALFRAHLLIATVIFATAAAGFMPLLAMTEPYSFAGRVFTNVWQPISSYLMWFTGQFFSGINWLNKARANPVTAGSFLILAAISLLLFFAVKKWGRIYCNLLCPVGALLRLAASFSFFKLSIKNSGCVNCGICATVCKAGCIDLSGRELDFSRCVVCLNCVTACKTNAISFKLSYFNDEKDFSPQRRALIGGFACAATTGLLPLALNAQPKPTLRIIPPGAGNSEKFTRRCISCHLCVSACPSKIIHAAPSHFFKGSLAQPELTFTHGMCEQTCNICSQICPTAAITPVSLEEKKTLKIAEVEYIKSLCVVETDSKDCGACAEHCPTKAVRMIPYKDGLMIPQIRPEICIGCGSCEHICPVRPARAIIVKPIGQQTHIELPKPKPIEDSGPLEEFPF